MKRKEILKQLVKAWRELCEFRWELNDLGVDTELTKCADAMCRIYELIVDIAPRETEYIDYLEVIDEYLLSDMSAKEVAKRVIKGL